MKIVWNRCQNILLLKQCLFNWKLKCLSLSEIAKCSLTPVGKVCGKIRREKRLACRIQKNWTCFSFSCDEREDTYATSAWQSDFSRESDDNPSDIWVLIIIMLWHHNPHQVYDVEAPGVAGLPADAALRLRLGALHQGAAHVQHQHEVWDPDLLHGGPGADYELPQPRNILPAAHRESRARDVQQQQGGEHLHPRQLLPALPAQRCAHQGQHRSVSSQADILCVTIFTEPLTLFMCRHRHQRHPAGQWSGLQHHAQRLLPGPLGGQPAPDQGRDLRRRGGRPGPGGHQSGEWGQGYSACDV